MKLFEYLGAGVPVVTTPYHDGLSTDFDGLLEFAATAPEFVARIEGILARGESKRQPVGWPPPKLCGASYLETSGR